MLRALWRRRGWLTHQTNVRRTANLLWASTQWALGRKRLASFPPLVKIDITPLCNLRCTICLHAHPNGNPALEKQRFHAGQKMTIEQYRRIIDEIRHQTSGVSLYYVGDPLVHRDVDQMCRIAADARLNTHINTNFSFLLSDDRIESIVTSGVTHLTVCLDGMTQENYQRTRVGGRLDWVLSNLRRTCDIRRRLRRRHPKIEVQYIRYQHNQHELESARRLCEEIGVDYFTSFWGSLGNFTDADPPNLSVKGPREKSALPACWWPYFATVIKYNGDVIPCCIHRIGMQYTVEDDCGALGNVFRTSLREVWNSDRYQAIRRMVCNPQPATTGAVYENLFCYGCTKLFVTDAEQCSRSGRHYAFEDLYSLDEKGLPVRRRKHAA